MGRKRKSDEPRATPSRSSARLASKPKIEEPEKIEKIEKAEKPKSTPKQKRTPRKKQGDQLNDTEISNESPNKSTEDDKGDVSTDVEENEPEKETGVTKEKQKNEPAAKKSKKDKTASSSGLNSTSQEDSEDFVMVKPSDVPAPESSEVQEAIKAQGEDAELLVNVVQVSKDDVPSADSEEVAKSVPALKPAEANHAKSSAEHENGEASFDKKTIPVVKDNGVVEAMDTSASKLSAVSSPDAIVAASNCTNNDST